jgi:four helix bundle protein
MRAYFDHEKLDVDHLELRFITWVITLLAKIKQRPTDARIAEVVDQLDRASLSALLNTAEGSGRRSDERERSSSMMRVVRQLNAQRVWMRWSRRAFAAEERSTKASNCSFGSLRC